MMPGRVSPGYLRNEFGAVAYVNHADALACAAFSIFADPIARNVVPIGAGALAGRSEQARMPAPPSWRS
jgi:hypothetical protein